MKDPILEIKNMTFFYKKGRTVLEHINYTFEKGKIYAVLGSSGSGKSTFLSLLGGIEKMKEGEILFRGENIWTQGARSYRNRHVGMVFQNYNLLEYMSGIENVMTAIEITDNVTEDPKALCTALLREVGIDLETAERNVKKISGGEQQRIAIARALAKGADLVLADEPTGNLDEDTAEEIMKLFLHVAHASGKCVILATHSRRLAAMCDVCLSIRDHILVSVPSTEL